MSEPHARSFAARALLLAVVSAATAACDSPGVRGRSQVVEGVRFEYGVAAPAAATRSAEAAAHTQPLPPRHVGERTNLYHVTLKARDVQTNAPIDDADVMLNIKGHGYPGHGSMPLRPIEGARTPTYGGYLALPQPGRYRLTFHVARPGRKYDPVRAVFSYERL
ncbi:hypothetical protein [Phenylobacterium zucineum]|nr:hypothetical protein [Phenylobacterium zucineum]